MVSRTMRSLANPTPSRFVAILIRALYAFVICILAVQHQQLSIIFNSIIFLGTLVLWFSSDERMYWYDAILMGSFASTAAIGIFGIVLPSTVIGWDKLFHFLSGLAIAGIILTAIPSDRHDVRYFVTILALSLVVFLGWEIYESFDALIHGLNVLAIYTPIDTTLDIVADTLGALVVLSWRFFRD